MKYHPHRIKILIVFLESGDKTLPGGQFDWGGFLLNDNGESKGWPQRRSQSPEGAKAQASFNSVDRTEQIRSRA